MVMDLMNEVFDKLLDNHLWPQTKTFLIGQLERYPEIMNTRSYSNL